MMERGNNYHIAKEARYKEDSVEARSQDTDFLLRQEANSSKTGGFP